MSTEIGDWRVLRKNSRPGGPSSKKSNFHIHKQSAWSARKFMAVQGTPKGKVQMQNYSTTENANDAEVPRTGAPPDVNATFGTSETTELPAADPIGGAAVDEHSTGPRALGPTATSSVPPPAAASTNFVTGHSQSLAAKRVLKVKCIEEPVRTSKDNMTSWKPPFDVEQGYEGSLKEIIKRAGSVRAPLQATPVPTGSARYGTTDELFVRLQQAIAGQAFLPEQSSALLTFWTICTWFADSLPIAPGLAIVGPEFEGDLALRTLRNFCRYPLMLAGADVTSLQGVDWRSTPTLLFYGPNITKQMATILGCATSRGYMVGDAGEYKDFYGPKAIYVGQEVSTDRMPRCSLQVRLQPTSLVPATQHSVPVTEALVQDLRNQLQRYRCKNLVPVYNSDFHASLLTSDTRAIANALGACIVDSPALQSKLVSLLGPVESQRQADRSTSLEAMTLEATLNLAHSAKAQILVNEVANEVNRIALARGERLHFSAETIGHRLKKVGLVTRRLGKAGKGLVMDQATMACVHELAGVYGGAGLDQSESNLHCPLCAENK